MDQQCNICGEFHNSDDCALIKITNYVPDNEIPSRAKLSLPNFLQLQLLTDGSYTIITKERIEKGTKFGPMIARKVAEINPLVGFPLKISTQNDCDEYYLDTTNENECNWLMFVCTAEFLEDQNLICYQKDLDIYYVTIKDIEPNQVLKVWYSPYYAKKMNRNLLVSSILLKNTNFDLETTVQLKNVDLNSLVKQQQKIVEKKQWLCKFCNKIDGDIVSFAKHLIVHYRLQLKKTCEICKQTFNSKKNLAKHLKIVHYSDNSQTNDLRINSLSSISLSPSLKTKTKDQSVGGPLLNDMFTDSSDLQQFDINTTINNNQNLLDDDIENLLLTDEVENFQHFDFNIIDDKQQQQEKQKSNDKQHKYECDICLKKFKKIHLLLIHLKQHTGEYLCTKCLKIFCRKENLITHQCNCVKLYQCDLCNDKKFPQMKYLKRHILIKHKLRYFCNLCKKNYYSKYELSQHNCKVSNLFKEKFVCSICDKVFYREMYLKKHLKTHLPKHDKQELVKTTTNNSTMCDICGTVLENKNSLYLHLKKHNEPKHTCTICSKKFHRFDSLKVHENTHKPTPEFECNLCLKKFKARSTLQGHINSHSGKLLDCKYCGMQFRYRSTLNKHIRNKHNNDDLNETSKILMKYFSCPICRKHIKLRSSLLRHLRKIHPNDFKNISVLDIRQNNLTKNNNNDDDDDDNYRTITELKRKQDDVKNDDDGDKKKEVCLSIPDLSEKEQEITLDNNAYILDNGTIIQPQLDSDKVIIYVLDQSY